MRKKSIFVYIYGYLPAVGYGGPVTSIANFVEHFGDTYDIRIIAGDHEHGGKERLPDIQDGWNKVGKASVLYLPESGYRRHRFCGLMEGLDVAMIYLTGVFCIKLNKPAIDAARKLGIKVVIATRGELLKNILAMKKWKKIPYLKMMKTVGYFNGCKFQITSDEEYRQLKKYLAVADKDIVMLPNLHGKRLDFKHPPKEAGKARLVFVSRIHPKKNLLDAISALIEVRGDVLLDIYGPIEDGTYWKRCRDEIEKVPDNVKIQYRGCLTMKDAKKVYYDYHAFLFPTLSENYGHVIVESVLAGCIPIISRRTTPWDDLDGNGGFVDDLHDIDGLAGSVEKVVDMAQEEYYGYQKRLAAFVERKLKMEELIDGYRKMIGGV